MKKINQQKGSVLTISILVLLATVIAVSSSVSNLFVSYITNIRGVGFGAQASEASLAAGEDVMWRLKNNKQVDSVENYQIGSSTVVVNINDADNTKNIVSTASLGGYSRTTTTTFTPEVKPIQ
jgi:uncharacterized transporter YbjL